MRFNRLEVSCFRNLGAVGINLAPGLNTFYGDNGAGKTALLEAVHLLCRGRSFRTQKTQTLIQTGKDQLVVRGVIDDEARGTTTLAFSKDRQARTEMRLNGEAERRLSQVARLTPLQVMLPDIGELVFGPPAKRRSWLDWGTFHVKPSYLETLRKYLRAVKQRNALLKDHAGQQTLRPWHEEVARLGEVVTEDRLDYLDRLLPHFRAVLTELAPGLDLDVEYRRGWGVDETLSNLLAESSAREVKYASTLWGPHRADVQIRADNSPASAVLSRGQGKLVASALQIGQASLLSESEQRSTVFLIDDAGAELDVAHNARFFAVLERLGGQILATTTRYPSMVDEMIDESVEVDPDTAVFHVEHGRVTPSK